MLLLFYNTKYSKYVVHNIQHSFIDITTSGYHDILSTYTDDGNTTLYKIPKFKYPSLYI